MASTQNSRYDDDSAAIIVGTTSASAARVTGFVAQAPTTPGRVLVAAFAGQQRTGGYAISIDAVQRDADRLVVRATFIGPPPGALVTQAFTSPAHVVSIASTDVAGAREAVLLDGQGTERARTTLP
ncbi:MAG TPA: protease complex subunit PrcB family protein [Candidatus Limnocylindria bacterium]